MLLARSAIVFVRAEQFLVSDSLLAIARFVAPPWGEGRSGDIMAMDGLR